MTVRATIKEIEAALQTGNLAQLKEWVARGDRFKRNRYNLTDGNNKALCLAAEHDQLEVVKWLVDKCGSTVVPTHPKLRSEIIHCTPRYVANEEEVKVPWFMNACLVALRSNHYDVAEWLLRRSSRNLSPEDFYDVLDALMIIMMSNEWIEPSLVDSKAVELFKWVFAFINSDTEQIQKLFDGMLSYATVDWVTWLFQNSKVKIHVTIESMMLLMYRQEDGGFEILKWLIEDSGQFTLISSDTEQIQRLFNEMFGCATVDQVKWWLQPSEVKIRITIENIVKLRGRRDDEGFEIIKWLIEESGQIIDCRDWETYRDKHWDQDVVDYLDSVKQAQDASGVEDGIKAMRLKAKSRDAVRRPI